MEDGKYYCFYNNTDTKPLKMVSVAEMKPGQAMAEAIEKRIAVKKVILRQGICHDDLVLFDPFGEMSCDN